MLLTEKEMMHLKGSALTPQIILMYLMLASGVSAVYKILTSKSGRLSFAGFNFQWTKQ